MLTLKRLDYLFLFLLLLELIFNQSQQLFEWHYVSKLLLMPCLMVYWWQESRSHPSFLRQGILLALLFSWLGDGLLLFQETGPLFFPAGLGAFLLAHICYCIVFYWLGQKSIPYWPVLLPILVFAGIVFSLVYSKLGPLMIPVVVYILAIISMVTLAGGYFGQAQAKNALWVLVGALLFVFSDSLIALNKFYLTIPRSALWIMLTYGLGQWLIVRGLFPRE